MSWNCVDCDVDTNEIAEYYMVHELIWEWFGAGEGLLCIGCLEHRLNRDLDAGDFMDCPLNDLDNGWRKSDRLIDRLKRV